jgi:hypothetical protein
LSRIARAPVVVDGHAFAYPKQFGEMLIFGTEAGFLYAVVLYASTTLVPTATYLIIAAAALGFSIIGR